MKIAVTAAIVDVSPSPAEADFVPIVAVSTAVKRDKQDGINANASELQEITVPSHRADIVLATTCFAAIRQKSCVYLPQLKRSQPSASALGLPLCLLLLPPTFYLLPFTFYLLPSAPVRERPSA